MQKYRKMLLSYVYCMQWIKVDVERSFQLGERAAQYVVLCCHPVAIFYTAIDSTVIEQNETMSLFTLSNKCLSSFTTLFLKVLFWNVMLDIWVIPSNRHSSVALID